MWKKNQMNILKSYTHMHKMGNGLPVINKQSDCLSLVTFFCVQCEYVLRRFESRKRRVAHCLYHREKICDPKRKQFFQEASTSRKNFSSKEDVNCNNNLWTLEFTILDPLEHHQLMPMVAHLQDVHLPDPAIITWLNYSMCVQQTKDKIKNDQRAPLPTST